MKRKANFVMTEDMQLAVKAEAQKRGISESALLREWVADCLKVAGYHVSRKPRNWGGARTNSKRKGGG